MKFFSVIFLAVFVICAVQAEAPQCLSVCPASHVPTCGFNGHCHKQFSNDCQLNLANCNGKDNFKVVDLAKCSDKSATQC